MCTEKNKIATLMVIVSVILSGTTYLLARECSYAGPGVMTEAQCCFTFTGNASGGTFMFCQYLGGNTKCSIVETTAGEPAEAVVARLADIIDEKNPFGWIIVRGGPKETGARVVTSSGSELKGLAATCEQYIIAGTESGLGIPKPPHSLTCNFNPEAKTISLKWVNPSLDAYDSVRIMFNRIIGGTTLPGKSESYVVDLNYFSDSKNIDNELAYFIKKGYVPKDTLSNIAGNLVVWVYGIRNDIPSNAAAIHVNNNIQEELFGIPFTCGVAPNWKSWSFDANEEKIRFEEGKKEGNTIISSYPHEQTKIFDAKSFCQIVNFGDKGGTGGVFRKFIGLTPGHTYRIKTRVATLNEPNEKNWSVSVHATPNGPEGKDLSLGQMAGLEPLPVGNKGNAAGRIALFDSSLTTKGQFNEISTGKTVDGQEIKDITLPPGVDSITIWVRCVSAGPMSAAIDWISLEDLSI